MVTNAQSQVDLAGFFASKPSLNIDQQDLEEVAKEFESLFMNMMLKSMRQANRTLSEGNYFNSFESQMYEDMLDQKLSVHLGKSHTLGIANLLINQFTPDRARSNYDLKMADDHAMDTVPMRRVVFESQEDFVAEILPRAGRVAKDLGIEPGFIVAQAALETGWGRHMMFDARARNSHNLFGIKANADWQGKTVAIESLEVKQGVAVKEKSQFKVYDSYDESLRDYAKLLLDNPRYASAVNTGADIVAFGRGLLKGGYATDPDYASKLAKIMKYPVLNGHQYALEVR